LSQSVIILYSENMNINEKPFYSVAEFAEKLRVHPNTVRNAIHSGRISAFRVGSGKRSMYRIPGSEIERMMAFDLMVYREEND